MSRRPNQEVIVLDSENKFLEYTNPGMARKLLKEKKAKIFSRNPFSIKLIRNVKTSSIRRKTMAVKNFTDYFKEERDVYVQNMSNSQVSMEFPMGNNRVEGFTLPPTRDPVNLTQEIPFEAIKRSMDFRKMLSRRPPAIQLLDEEQYLTYFKKKAASRGLKTSDGAIDVDAAIDDAADKRKRMQDRSVKTTESTPEPLHEVTERGTGPGGAKRFGEKERVTSTAPVSEEEMINPRVLHLCNQVKSELEDKERMSARDLLEALEDIPNLKLDDYEHVRAHGYYRSVKKWAKKQMERVIEEQGEEDGADDDLESVAASA